jgi:hypothetical protein
MQLAEINFLSSPEGQELLRKYQDFSETDLYRELMKNPKMNSPYLSAAVTLIKLRRKAAGKFSRSSEMFFTPLSLEQSTGEEISKYIAARFGRPKKIVDLTCSLGGNLIFLCLAAQETIAVDKDENNIALAKLNTGVYGCAKNIKFICGDAYDNIISDADAYFIDPARDRPGKTKTRSILNCEPNLSKIIPEIFKVTENLGVKISPAFDYQEIKLLPGEPEVEIISEDNVCKVAMLWFGKFRTAKRRATCLINEKIYSFVKKEKLNPIMISSKPLSYLYEPNKAIIKAHLIEEIASEFKLEKINRQTSFLTSDGLIKDKRELFRICRLESFAPFSLKEIKTELKAKNIERVNIITKRFPQLPPELYKKLKIKEGGNKFLIVTSLSDEKYYYLLADRV